jgi:hypothetical protein
VQITVAKEKSISLKIPSNENKRHSFSKQQKKNKNLLSYITHTIYNKLKIKNKNKCMI